MGSGAAADSGAMRVVVVDDNDGFRQALRALLVSEGLEVVGEAADTRAAMDTVLATQPDVALVDLRLPGGSGAAMIGEMLRTAPGTRVVVLSGSGERADVDAAMEAGARRYLVKGADPSEICEALRDVVRR